MPMVLTTSLMTNVLTTFTTSSVLLSSTSWVLTLYFIYSWVTTLSYSISTPSYKTAFILFIISEAAIFSMLFYSYFTNVMSPTPLTPPFTMSLTLPLAMTIILLTSSFTLYIPKYGPYISILLGTTFSSIQYYEYMISSFDITTSPASSSFFALTGLHAIHVIMGITLLILSTLYPSPYMTYISHTYWHFVDVIWLFLFTTVY